MDAVEGGQAFTVTRDGHRIGELVPLRRKRQFVPRSEFAALSRTAPALDPPACTSSPVTTSARAESEFDPLPFDAEAARLYGRLAAAVHGVGRTPRRRIADLMIAATAAAHGLPCGPRNPTTSQDCRTS